MIGKRSIPAVIFLFVVLSLGVFPVWATSPAQQVGDQPRVITGSYQTTNPIYPTIGADTGIVLYDITGLVQDDYDFVPAIDSQILGRIDGTIVSGDYVIELPPTPDGGTLDFDGDSATPPAVQVFAPSTYINFLGDRYINRGETSLDMSARVDPMTFDVVGGYLVVWTANAGELFPSGAGQDGTPFTPDDPLMPLPAGWSVIALEDEPFTVLRNETVDIPLFESFGGLHDYSALSYQDAWESLFQRTRETYPFTTEKNIDWDRIYNTITPIIQTAQSDLEFHLGIAQFGSLIPDTHIGYVSIQVMQAYLLGGVGIGFPVVTDDGEVVITYVAPDSPAAQAGILPGDVLVAVDGIPALDVLAGTPLMLTSASTPHGRRYLQAATMLQGPVNSRTTLTWKTVDGAQTTGTLTRVFDFVSIVQAFEGGLSGADGVITSRMLDSGLGYIGVRGFAEEVSRADEWFNHELDGLIAAGAQGVIIDVRGNGGGLIQLAMAMAGRFFPDSTRLFDFYYADGRGDFAYRGFVEILASESYYDGPVAVLVDEMTGSASDMFVYAMQIDDRAVIVGHTPTGGFTGEVGDGQYLLPGVLEMQIPTGRPIHPVTGVTLIEGEGVQPDIRVPLTYESIFSPEDEVLQAAEAALLAE
ncbi:MAG: PDZ domain-containing protein [Anaerolineae bacterium]|nr:PDZ domain-containing protein [Anaerolineae bacterium]